MSLTRFLTDSVDVLRAQATVNRSGEEDEDYVTVYAQVPCRVRNRVANSFTDMGGTPLVTGDYTAIFAPAAATVLPLPGDQLLRQADGLKFTVVGNPERQGDPGHAMTHYAVPLRRLG